MTLMNKKITPIKPFIIMMYGYPGCGKTAFGRQFHEELGIVHLQEDKIRHDLFGENTSEGAYRGARKVLNYMAADYLRSGISVVYDADVFRSNDRRRIRDLASQSKAKSILIWLQTDPDTTFERTQNRDHRKADDKYATEYTEDTYREILSQMQNPDQLEDYIVISAKHTFNSQRSTVFKKLFDMKLISIDEMQAKTVKPGLTNLIPKNPIQHRGDIIRRDISIR